VMVIARWRLRRILAIETSLLANELIRRAEDIDDEFSEMTGDERLAWVFQRLADNGQSLALSHATKEHSVGLSTVHSNS
jgi:hypothetical protein